MFLTGMREHQALACYLALAMTSVGHLLPLVCSQGLTQLESLLACYKYDAVLVAMHNIVALFVDSTDTLLMCTRLVSKHSYVINIYF